MQLQQLECIKQLGGPPGKNAIAFLVNATFLQDGKELRKKSVVLRHLHDRTPETIQKAMEQYETLQKCRLLLNHRRKHLMEPIYLLAEADGRCKFSDNDGAILETGQGDMIVSYIDGKSILSLANSKWRNLLDSLPQDFYSEYAAIANAISAIDYIISLR